jgi:hypothetical protein
VLAEELNGGGCYKFLKFFPQQRRRLIFVTPYVAAAADTSR